MKNFFDKNILVTGGTGFVGSHLVEELINEDAHVVTTYQTLNRHSYFFTRDLEKKSLMIGADICNFKQIFNIVTKNNVEYIFHLAAQPLVEPAYYNPQQTLYTNVLGTINVLESARLFPKIKGVVVASSDKAYGKLAKKKYFETDALRGDHPYEVSKSAADLISHAYFKTYGTPVVTTRFGNIYGEGDLNFSRIVPGIMKSIINEKTLILRSNGKYIRDYLYVKDVARGYLLLVKNIKKTKGEAYNFGSSETLSVFDLINIVQKKLEKKINCKIIDTAKNEIPYQSHNYSKIKKKLGWQPQYSLQTTIDQIAQWYKNHFDYE